MDHLTDKHLVDRAAVGCGDALAELYRRHLPVAERFAWSLTGCRPKAEDLASDAFVRTWAKVRSGTRPSSFQAYLLTAVRNAHRDQVRRPRLFTSLDDERFSRTLAVAPDHSQEVVERLVVREAMDSLPPRYQDVLVWTAVQGHSNHEVARRLGINVNAASSLAYRARKALSLALAEERPRRVEVVDAEGYAAA